MCVFVFLKKTKDNPEEFPLTFQVVLLESFKEKVLHEMTFPEQLDTAICLKNIGNVRYEKERYRTALRVYKR